jgi:hypothetical protein
VLRMLDELEATTTHAGELKEMIEEITADDRDGRRRDGMLGAISLGGRAKTLKEGMAHCRADEYPKQHVRA